MFLKSVEISGFDEDRGSSSAIKGTLSTGLKSPVFKKFDTELFDTVTINFDRGNNRVSKLRADTSTFRGAVWKITFYNKNGDMIGRWREDDADPIHEAHSISDDEELIGFYGIKDDQDYFTGLGFIVKAPLDD